MLTNSVIQTKSATQDNMPIPDSQDIVEPPSHARERWLDKAAFSLYEARRAEFPDAYPLAWDQATRQVRAEFRFLAMSAYRRSLPLVASVLVEIVAMNYANLEGWIYPDCDNKYAFNVPDDDRAAFASQRRQNFRHKAQQIIASIFGYLEMDCDTEAQRKQSVGGVTLDRQRHYLTQAIASVLNAQERSAEIKDSLMSTFSEWELNGGIDPYTAREQQERDAEAEHFSKCGCGDARCQIDDRDSTNVNVNGTWFTADCTGLCWTCGEVDDLQKLMKAGYGRLTHEGPCPDRVNEVRR